LHRNAVTAMVACRSTNFASTQQKLKHLVRVSSENLRTAQCQCVVWVWKTLYTRVVNNYMNSDQSMINLQYNCHLSSFMNTPISYTILCEYCKKINSRSHQHQHATALSALTRGHRPCEGRGLGTGQQDSFIPPEVETGFIPITGLIPPEVGTGFIPSEGSYRARFVLSAQTVASTEQQTTLNEQGLLQ